MIQMIHNTGLVILGILMLAAMMAMSDIFSKFVDMLWGRKH